MYQKKLKRGEATCPHTTRQPEQALSFLAREGSWKGFGSLWTNGGRKTDRSWLKTLCHPKCPSKSKSLSSNSRSWSSKLNDQVLRGLRPGGTYFGDRHISEGNDVRYEYNERPCLKNPNWYMLGMGYHYWGPLAMILSSTLHICMTGPRDGSGTLYVLVCGWWRWTWCQDLQEGFLFPLLPRLALHVRAGESDIKGGPSGSSQIDATGSWMKFCRWSPGHPLCQLLNGC
jgi:hypothetical protein